jgi:PadR family transcriptional regulator
MELTILELHTMLAIVALQPNAYGVTIRNHIRRYAGYEPLLGSIYASLVRLEQRDFVQSKYGEKTRERGGRGKRYFSVTADGSKMLRKALLAVATLKHAARLRVYV